MRKRFIDIQEMPVVTPEEQAQQRAETEAELTAATHEHTERYEEVSSAMDDVEKAFVAHDAVNVVADEVEKTIEVGGMPVEAANAVTAAVEALRINLGFRKNSSPALESFGKGEDRVAATKVALEGLKDTAAKIWEAIKKAFAKLVDWFKSLFSLQARQEQAVKKKIEQALDELKEELEGEKHSGSDSGQKEEYVHKPAIGRWSNGLLLNGKVPGVHDIEKQLQQNRELLIWAEELGKAAISSVRDLERSLLDDSSDDTSKQARDKMFSILRKIPGGVERKNGGESHLEVRTHLGDAAIVGTLDDNGRSGQIAFKLQRNLGEPIQGELPSFGEMIRIMEIQRKMPSILVVKKEISEALNKTADLLLKQSNLSSEGGDARIAKAKEVLKTTRGILRTVNSVLNAVSTLDKDIALSLCALSLA